MCPGLVLTDPSPSGRGFPPGVVAGCWYNKPGNVGGNLAKLALAFPCLFPSLWSFAFGTLLCAPSICAFGSIDAFGFVLCLGERDLSPWHLGPLGLVTWSGGNARTLGKVSARAEWGRLTEEKLISVHV